MVGKFLNNQERTLFFFLVKSLGQVVGHVFFFLQKAECMSNQAENKSSDTEAVVACCLSLSRHFGTWPYQARLSPKSRCNFVHARQGPWHLLADRNLSLISAMQLGPNASVHSGRQQHQTVTKRVPHRTDLSAIKTQDSRSRLLTGHLLHLLLVS